ncbi:MAG: UvrD-helicase domain-containing protein [Caldilineaceae bacterium]|nr:UvrD-helicase domain-containing protein [Caldilineaceae bacterium]
MDITEARTEIVADLHIHSHYSRATSKDLTFEHLARWAQFKGVHLVGTGDIAHPGWLQEMRQALVPAEEGLFRLRDEAAVAERLPAACRRPVRFLLAGEISNIYTRHGAVRKVHNVVFAPTLEAVARLQVALEKIGNIRADGRPILGLDSRDLLELVLEVDPRCALIPAHIWTPWFSMLGSKSGFDSVEECFGDLTPHIFALETGLSSDPPMNWRVSNLDRYTLVSNSDAHSPQKLAREATLLRCEWSYDAVFAALRGGDPALFGGTLEFFPEEGKYHLDGHRKCSVCWEPPATLAHGGICPVCGKPVTVGVMHRVEELADRPVGAPPPRPHAYTSLVPLPEILGEVYAVGAGSRRVQQEYEKLLAQLGPELEILRAVPLEEIAAAGGSRLAEAIRRVRAGEVHAEGGYDGEYGVIRVFAGAAPAEGTPQLGLFGAGPAPEGAATAETPAQRLSFRAVCGEESLPVGDSAGEIPRQESRNDSVVPPAEDAHAPEARPQAGAAATGWLARLNPDQAAAVACVDAPLLIAAGPGTGKTRTLTVRLAHLVADHGVDPASMLAITFTNKAAEEMAERLDDLLGPRAAAMTVQTFHAFGLYLLHTYGAQIGLPQPFVLLGEEDRRGLLARACSGLNEPQIGAALIGISAAKNRLLPPAAPEVTQLIAELDLPAIYTAYQNALAAAHAVDFDDLLMLPVQLLETQPAVRAAVQARYRWISVDEYQDVNLAQVRLLRLLAAGGANLCAIGDPDQAIYGFRGADHRYFLSFQAEYPGARVVQLRQSYRSPQALLDAAGQVIAHNPDRAALRLWSDFAGAVKLDTYQASTDRAEAEYVVHRIEQMVGGTSYFSLDSGRVDARGAEAAARSFGDFAVLYRLNAQARPLEEAFARSGIPYQIVGQAPLTAYREIRGVLALLWLHRYPQAGAHLHTLLGTGRSALDPAAIDRIAVWLAATEAGSRAAHLPALGGIAARGRARVERLAAFWDEAARLGAPAVEELVRRGQALWAELEPDAPGAAQEERAGLLLRRAAAYGDRLDVFLEEMTLQREQDGYDPRAGRVALMTLHAAKGLEFPVVFIVGCEEGLLPYLPAGRSADLEEERRLFYVGMTRAREKLILTSAARRFLFGQSMTPPVSRFVGDIAAALREVQTQAPRPPKPDKAEDYQLKLF